MRYLAGSTFHHILVQALTEVEKSSTRKISSLKIERNEYGEIVNVHYYYGAIAGRGAWKKREE